MNKLQVDQISREIQVQLWNYRGRNYLKPILVVHPQFLLNFCGVVLLPEFRYEIYGVEVNLCQSLKENEFIIGEKFKVTDDL